MFPNAQKEEFITHTAVTVPGLFLKTELGRERRTTFSSSSASATVIVSFSCHGVPP